MSENNKLPTLLTVNGFVEKHDFIKIGGLRHLIHCKEKNGLHEAGAILKIGKKVLIDEEKFFNWIQKQNER